MSAIDENLGVQSYCFRHFKDNTQVAGMVKEIGLSAIEVCAVHANFNDLASWKDTVKIYSDAGVKILSIGVQTFTGKPEEREWFECAAAAGAQHISAHFSIDTFQTAIPAVQKLCDEFGIKVGIHCHGGYHFCGPKSSLEYLTKLGAPQIGVLIDTAWAMQTGPRQGNPVQWAKDFGDRVTGVHYKDFVFDKDAMWHDVVVGEGNLDLPEFVKTLDDNGFDGVAIIEYEADVENPVPALTKCVQKMRELAG